MVDRDGPQLYPPFQVRISELSGAAVRVVFVDPCWLRGETYIGREKPQLEVFGRVGDMDDDGFEVRALDFVRPVEGAVSPVEGQFVPWGAVVSVEPLRVG